MASLWMQEKGCQPVKVAGHLSPDQAIRRFAAAHKQARQDGVLLKDGDMSFIADGPLDGSRKIALFFIEPLSPPTALETGQPKWVEMASGDSTTRVLMMKRKDGSLVEIRR